MLLFFTCSSPICRQPASRAISGNALTIRPMHNNPYFFLTAGDRHLRLWSIVREQKKLYVQDVHLASKTRTFYCARIDKKDEFAYLGSGTGDIIKIVLNCCDRDNVTRPGTTSGILGAFGTHNPRKPTGRDCNRYVNGVRALYVLEGGRLLIGAGDGEVQLVEERTEVPLINFRDYPEPTWPYLRVVSLTLNLAAVMILLSFFYSFSSLRLNELASRVASRPLCAALQRNSTSAPTRMKFTC